MSAASATLLPQHSPLPLIHHPGFMIRPMISIQGLAVAPSHPHFTMRAPTLRCLASASPPPPSSHSSSSSSRINSPTQLAVLLSRMEPRPPIMKPKLSYRGFSTATSATLLDDGISTTKQSLMADTATPARLPPPHISKTDKQFADEGVEFVWGIESLNYDELNDLFQKVGFPRRDPEKLAMALGNTYSCIWIKASRKSRMAKEGQMLGFARATSDGALSATIWDVAVNPAWQRGGLGRGLVERLTEDLVEHGISTITLYAEPGVVGLYEKLGFVKDPQGVKGLAFQSNSKKGKAVERNSFLENILKNKPSRAAAASAAAK